MMEQKLETSLQQACKDLYQVTLNEKQIQVQKTRAEFEGDFTIVVFPLLSVSRKSPEQTASDLGDWFVAHLNEVDSFSVIKGFLNLSLTVKYWIDFLNSAKDNLNYGYAQKGKSKPVVVEYSAPNTNKPLHLGHIRNNLLGWAVSEIFKASGQDVVKVNLINDRGIHICKSMLAWQKWGGGKTPESENMKGDKLVGEYYVRFDQELKAQVASLIKKGIDKEAAENNAPLLLEAKEMLKKWEQDNPEIKQLWEKMNAWVYDGFDKTYNRMGVDFDKVYYESDTYLLGKELVKEGLEKRVLYQKPDGSIWCDLTDEGLDEKLLLRADGTSVYMTQDLGTAQLRHDDFDPSKLVYVVGNEQIYHFDVLKLILKKLGKSWAEHIFHLSYGMVELPHGKMKSREGKVVDADDLMDEMYETAKRTSEELGKFDDFTPEESDRLYQILSLGALKYFILKVDPKKTMTFNPEESIDFNGNTGPFIQYSYARIQSILRKAIETGINAGENISDNCQVSDKERSLMHLLYDYPQIVQLAAENMSPAQVANYVYELAKEFNQFYHESPILKEEDMQIRSFRLDLSKFIGDVIKSAMGLLGIEVPERM
jgi:arginyl-tRNA synthetase